MRKPKKATLPHWPGETQMGAPSAISDTNPKLVGLKRCFPLHVTRNLLEIVTTAASAATVARLVRHRRQRESPEMRALRASKRGSRQSLVQAYWVRSAAPRKSAARAQVMSKWRQPRP